MSLVQQENWFDCSVCRSKTRFFHLNAKLCRACASYYRRCLTENLKYTCKYDGKCQLDKTKCRSCRFQQCQDAGARLPCSLAVLRVVGPAGVNRMKSITKVTNESEQTVVEQPSSSTNVFTIIKSQPKLDELVRGYDLFLLAQRSLFTMKHPEFGIANDKFIRPKKKFLSKMEIESIPLVLKFFNDSFGPFKALGKIQKVNLVVEAFDDFSLYNKGFLTCKYFPTLEDERVVHTHGYYTTTVNTDPEWFFEGYVVIERIDEYIQIINPMRNKIMRFVNKARQIRARKVDYLAFMFLSLWKHIEYANLLTDDMTAYKEAVLKEWMDSLREEYGKEEAVKRFTKLMLFYYESDDLALELSKSKTVLRVYLLRNDEDDWCDIQAHMKKLNLVDDDEKITSTV